MSISELNLTIKNHNKDWPVFVAKPEGEPKGGIVVIHEIFGLNDEIKRLTREFAEAGYIAIAPDLLAEYQPITKINPELFGKVFSDPFRSTSLETLKACVDWLKEQGLEENQIAMIGFCFGGTYTTWYLLEKANIAAGISFYGQVPDEAQLKTVQKTLLVFFGEDDDFLTPHRERLHDILTRHDLPIAMHTYANAGHSFMHPDHPERYRPQAAQDAWHKTLDFLKQHLLNQ